MAYPSNTASILSYQYPDTEALWEVSAIPGGADITRWEEALIGDPKPTEQQVTDWGNDPEFISFDEDQKAPISPINWYDVPPAQRQFIDVPYQSNDRLVIKRIFKTWNTPDDIYALQANLYSKDDAEGMSIKIHDDAGTYLYTMDLVETAPGSGVWRAETQSGAYGSHLERKAWRYYVFKGVDLTPEMRLPFEAEKSTHNIKWNQDITGISDRGNGGQRGGVNPNK